MKLTHIDITFDLETCSLDPNAAVIQIAALPWVRGSKTLTDLFPDELPTFESKVDLRSCVMGGFDFDRNTIQWWSGQQKELRDNLVDGDCYPIDEVFREFCVWIADIKGLTKAETVSLWAQGADFDIAILRHVCNKYDIPLPVSHQDFRDARSFILELVAINNGYASVPADTEKLYECLPPLPQEAVSDGQPHNAFYDALRTSWNVNTCLSYIS